eukprot:COSAG01_NODE_6198_length_3798_cov_293.914572_7_plen_175_part_00
MSRSAMQQHARSRQQLVTGELEPDSQRLSSTFFAEPADEPISHAAACTQQAAAGHWGTRAGFSATFVDFFSRRIHRRISRYLARSRYLSRAVVDLGRQTSSVRSDSQCACLPAAAWQPLPHGGLPPLPPVLDSSSRPYRLGPRGGRAPLLPQPVEGGGAGPAPSTRRGDGVSRR